MPRRETKTGHGFGTFAGVYTPAILTIIGVVMYLRFGWVLGQTGLAGTLAIVTMSSAVTFLTALSIAALATNMQVKGGGAYYMVSRSLGLEAGAAVGVPLFLSQAISVAFYVAGFVEAFTGAVPWAAGWNPRIAGMAVLAALAALSFFSAGLALKAQFFIMAAIAASLVSFFLGGPPEASAVAEAAARTVPRMGFWGVLAVFFPAVTGMLSGLGMSGDLKNPARSLPLGIVGSVVTGYAIYMAVPVALDAFAGGSPEVLSDPMIMQKCARWAPAVLAGVWAASLSSALGALLAAPRVLQAIAQDKAAPRVFARGWGDANEPRAAAALVFAIAAAALAAGDIDVLAPVLTMFNLTVYGLLNVCAGAEELMGNPSWRPEFRVPWYVSAAGAFACFALMFMIDAGATFAAAGCIAAIFAFIRARKLNSGWNDIRRGLRMYAARSALLKTAGSAGDERNWRPNLLVFGGAGDGERHLVELAGDISRNRGFLTFAHVVPRKAWTPGRAEAMAAAMREHAASCGAEAFVRIQPGDTQWSGMRALVESFGFGPLVPDTVVAGYPDSPEALPELASVLALAARNGKNAVVAPDPEDGAPPPGRRTVDIWWRGRQGNAPFMLALATLMRGARQWRKSRLRLCRAVGPGEKPESARLEMESFLQDARISAEVTIVETDGRTAQETIRSVSAGSALVFMGLRTPAPDEPPESWAAHLAEMRENARGLHRTVFALASSSLDFRAIFR